MDLIHVRSNGRVWLRPAGRIVMWHFIWFMIIGIIAGFLAGKIMTGRGFGLVGDLIVG